MSVMIIEYVPQDINLVADIILGGAPANKSNIRFIGDKLFDNEKQARNWIDNTLIPQTQMEANNEYGRITGLPKIYDKDKVDKQLDDGQPLVSKNLFIIPVIEHIVVKGYPNR